MYIIVQCKVVKPKVIKSHPRKSQRALRRTTLQYVRTLQKRKRARTHAHAQWHSEDYVTGGGVGGLSIN